MTNYTPTTDEVRTTWPTPCNETEIVEQWAIEFDRWLAEVSREERNAEREGIMDLLKGVMSTSKPCYILRGIKGEYYICEEEIFKESYEESND